MSPRPAMAHMAHYAAVYTLRNGTRGVLDLIASSSCAAILTALDTFGDALRSCSARRAT